MDLNTRLQVTKALRTAASKLTADNRDAERRQNPPAARPSSQERRAEDPKIPPPSSQSKHPFAVGGEKKDAVLELKKATRSMDDAMKKFKAKPTDDAYFDVVAMMKSFRQWVYKVHYESSPATASAQSAFTSKYDLWQRTGSYRPLLAHVLNSAATARSSRVG